MGELVDRADMYRDLANWLDENGPAWSITDDTVSHLADHLVVVRGWRRS